MSPDIASIVAAKSESALHGRAASNPKDVLMLGCVAYSNAVASIWEGMRQYFLSVGVAFDFTMFTTYDRQVEALLSGQIDVAWNGPLAHVRVQKRTGGTSLSLGMRDVDQDFKSHLIVRNDAGITDLKSLAGKRLATGTYDSPQACIYPLEALASAPGGAALLKSLHVVRFDRDLGKHGDTAAGELEVIRALSEGEVDAGFVSDVMWTRALAAADVDAKALSVLTVDGAGVTPPFDHCQFDALKTIAPAKRKAFESALFAMKFSDPDQRKVMVDEGIQKEWARPRESGYDAMRSALDTEPVEPFPPARDVPGSHRFASLEVREVSGFPASEFVRSCAVSAK